jgi:hypothetical protein
MRWSIPFPPSEFVDGQGAGPIFDTTRDMQGSWHLGSQENHSEILRKLVLNIALGRS